MTPSKKKLPPAVTPEPSMAEIYDMLMVNIEPELTTLVIPVLDDWYKDETPEQKKARGQRYAKAFAEFEKQFAKLMTLWKGQLTHMQDEAEALRHEHPELFEQP